ncbi:MAG: TIGR00730 family Rossman fold protein [Verrucomicrobiota bacterium]
MKSLCVYCGSSSGHNPVFRELAIGVGRLIAQKELRLVYGGGHVGLMGAVADGCLEAGGEVIGVIPGHLMDRELGHTGVTDLRIVKDMHERKAMMAELSDAFLALPGSVGTLEEIVEIVTWVVLGLHGKPCGVLNFQGYYDHFAALLQKMTDEGFLKEKYQQIFRFGDDPEALIDELANADEDVSCKWD